MAGSVYIAKEYESLRHAIEMAQAIARATGKKASLTFQGATFEISSDTPMKEAIDKYLAIKDKLYQEQKVKKH